MIQEEYVGYEVAKLLNENGFTMNPDVSRWNIGQDNTMYWVSCIGAYSSIPNNKTAYYLPKDSYPCPTQQMAMRWLREVHKIDIVIDVYSKHSWDDTTDYCVSIFSHGHRIMRDRYNVFDTYEDACEAAAKYCLENLIK